MNERRTIGRGGLEVSVQQGQGAPVARLHDLHGDGGGPGLQGVQGHVGQGNVAQAQLQSSLRMDTQSIKHTHTHTRSSSDRYTSIANTQPYLSIILFTALIIVKVQTNKNNPTEVSEAGFQRISEEEEEAYRGL